MNLESRVKKLEAAGQQPRPLPPLLPGESTRSLWLWSNPRGTDAKGRATREAHRMCGVLGHEIDNVPAGMEGPATRRFVFVLLLFTLHYAPANVREQAAELVGEVLDRYPGDQWPYEVEWGSELYAWLVTDRRWVVIQRHLKAMEQEASKRRRTPQGAGRR